jgi:hypothetical protein
MFARLMTRSPPTGPAGVAAVTVRDAECRSSRRCDIRPTVTYRAMLVSIACANATWLPSGSVIMRVLTLSPDDR